MSQVISLEKKKISSSNTQSFKTSMSYFLNCKVEKICLISKKDIFSQLCNSEVPVNSTPPPPACLEHPKYLTHLLNQIKNWFKDERLLYETKRKARQSNLVFRFHNQLTALASCGPANIFFFSFFLRHHKTNIFLQFTWFPPRKEPKLLWGHRKFFHFRSSDLYLPAQTTQSEKLTLRLCVQNLSDTF